MSKLAELGQFERRLHRRYPIALEAEYRLVNRDGTQCQGSCRTVNISSGGVLLEATAVLFPLGSIEVSIKWPCFLRDVVPLKLMVRGDIVRVDGNSIAVEMTWYEFRTATEGQLKNRRQR
jgi:PilZ domain